MSRLAPALAAPALLHLACSAAPPPPPPSSLPSPPPPSAAAATPTAAPTAAPVAEPKSVAARRIALDNQGGCAVLEDSGVACWSGERASAPRRLPDIHDAVDVSRGGALAILRADGTVLSYPRGDTHRAPHTLALTGIRSLSQGGGSACALRADGKVSCWAGGLHDDKGQDRRAVEVPGLQGVKALGASYGRACAVRDDARVACWEITARGRPRLEVVPDLGDVVEIQVSAHIGCARDQRRAVSCFRLAPHPGTPTRLGEADSFAMSGESSDSPLVCLGTSQGVRCKRHDAFSGSYVLPALEDSDLPSADGAVVTQIAAAKWAACSLDARGKVQCWGHNFNALLGQPDSRFVEEPTLVPDLPKARAIAAGDRFTCALSEAGKVYCWGETSGATDIYKSPIRGVVRPVPEIQSPERLVANVEYACAFSKANEATCFYGLANDQKTYAPVRVPALDGALRVRLPDLGFANVAAAIGPTGQLLVGPSSGFDTLKGLALSPVKTLSLVHELTTVSLGLAGAPDSYGFALAVADDGHVFSVEVGDAGQRPPVQLRGLDGALALQSHGYALLPGGKIVSGRLHGQAEVEAATSPLVSLADGPIPCGLTADGKFGCLEDGEFHVLFERARQIVSGARGHHCALDDAGAVRCRGDNSWGQCGVFIGVFRADQPIAVRLE